MHKTPNVFPIVGGRKVDHLRGNIEALKLELTPEDIKEIEDAYPFDVGFPMNFLFQFVTNAQYNTNMDASDVGLTQAYAHIKVPKKPQPVPAHKE